MPDCIDLRERFGSRFKIGTDPAATSWNRDPWYFTIPCSRGTVYPDGGDFLRIDIDGRPRLARMVAAIPGVEMVQDGDGESTLRFHVDQFEAVAALVRPYRRPTLTLERREELRQHARRFLAAEKTGDGASRT